jgi:hypothetical protein
LNFIYDQTLKTLVYFLKKKHDTIEVSKTFKKIVDKQCEKRIKMLQIDDGGGIHQKNLTGSARDMAYSNR